MSNIGFESKQDIKSVLQPLVNDVLSQRPKEPVNNL